MKTSYFVLRTSYFVLRTSYFVLPVACGLALAVGANAQPERRELQGLKRYAVLTAPQQNTKAPSAVWQALEAGTPQELIVLLDDAAVEAEANRLMESMQLTYHTNLRGSDIPA